MRVLNLVLIGLVAATVAHAQELTWQELVGRPELWPAQCTVKVGMDFQGGRSVRAGQKVNVVQLKPDEIDLATPDGRLNFAAEPDETDVLDLARAAYGQLTPKQRELTYAAVAQRRDLWPLTVTLTRTFDIGGGRSLRAGEQLRVADVQPGRLSVISDVLNTKFQVAPQVTDLMAQARTFVEDGAAGPRLVVMERLAEEKLRTLGPVAVGLEGKLIDPLTGKPQPLDPAALPRYFVFFRGSSTCPITRQFMPTMVNFYKQTKPGNADFEVIYLMTESLPATASFARASGLGWQSLPYDSTHVIPGLHKAISGLLPQLIVMDRAGRVVAEGTQNAAPAALRQLQALLQKTPARQ